MQPQSKTQPLGSTSRASLNMLRWRHKRPLSRNGGRPGQCLVAVEGLGFRLYWDNGKEHGNYYSIIR